MRLFGPIVMPSFANQITISWSSIQVPSFIVSLCMDRCSRSLFWGGFRTLKRLVIKPVPTH